jgi:hypothetical protein
MSDFIPRHVSNPHHFDIEHDCHGHWVARDRDGLTGGTFITYKDALRFALFETDGDSAHVHLLSERHTAHGRRARRLTAGL